MRCVTVLEKSLRKDRQVPVTHKRTKVLLTLKELGSNKNNDVDL
ncbi:MAG: hypothetical protein V9F01_01455 [Chitinophagaceae bacterium]